MSKEIYFGLAQWHHSKWYTRSSPSNASLAQYCNSFSSVEGNSSFYALPSEKSLDLWYQTSPDYFKFCFKFPQEISHKQVLTHCSRQGCDFFYRISLLKDKLGLLWLQLDARFSVLELQKLERFISALPTQFNYAVEVRHLDFFNKDQSERRFNQLLKSHNINRVIFDTRSLFANSQLTDLATSEALQAKPKVPTHVIATDSSPLVRIIVPMDSKLGEQVLQQWARKAAQWLDQGLTPYFFLHTPDNARAPELARYFSQLINRHRTQVDVIKLWGQQQNQQLLF
ncbi:MAG: hypothetical protein OFPI_39070 [Osedax symbiont Rs2]|nr:MAG: hypothetical protein OFPI_39070 [Osedax symbiont Rs2]